MRDCCEPDAAEEAKLRRNAWHCWRPHSSSRQARKPTDHPGTSPPASLPARVVAILKYPGCRAPASRARAALDGPDHGGHAAPWWVLAVLNDPDYRSAGAAGPKAAKFELSATGVFRLGLGCGSITSESSVQRVQCSGPDLNRAPGDCVGGEAGCACVCTGAGLLCAKPK